MSLQIFKKLNIGGYPKDYKPEVHGPYDPARFYGKKDIPFGEVKVQELPSWFGRRQMGVRPFVALISRTWWKHQHKYVLCEKGGVAPIIQIIFCVSTFYYLINYNRAIKYHNNYKYHW